MSQTVCLRLYSRWRQSVYLAVGGHAYDIRELGELEVALAGGHLGVLLLLKLLLAQHAEGGGALLAAGLAPPPRLRGRLRGGQALEVLPARGGVGDEVLRREPERLHHALQQVVLRRSYWSHTRYILGPWHPFGHTRGILFTFLAS